MQKISYQRMKLLRNKNAKIIITNNIEAEALLDLTKKLDYALRILKENAGGLYDYEDVAKNIITAIVKGEVFATKITY